MKRDIQQAGGILLVALVLLAVIVMFFSAVAGLISTQQHALAQQVRSAQAFHLADSGFDYFVSLLGTGACTPEQLGNQTIQRKLTDPETNQSIGSYFISISKTADSLTATSIGEPAPRGQCQAVAASVSQAEDQYRVSWRALGAVPCPSPVNASEPSC